MPLMCGLVAACAGSPARGNSEAMSNPQAIALAGAGGQGGLLPAADYRIGPLDLLEVKIFQIPDLDRAARVDQNGMISLPLIGNVMAAGKTVSELEADIARNYATTYLQNPRVSVFVKEFTSQRVSVTGAVLKPGIFVLDGPTTLLGAVSLAQGISEVASTTDVALIHSADGSRMGTFHNIDDIVSGTAPDPFVVGGDIVVVQKSGYRQTMKDLMSIAPVLSILPRL